MSKYSLEDGRFEEILFRATLPVRDVALSPNGDWIAVASEYVAVFAFARPRLTMTVSSW